jgi:hypothetical protein
MKSTEFISNHVPQETVEESIDPVIAPLPEFTFESANFKLAELLDENATCGGTGASSIAVSFSQEGNMPTDIIKRQQKYTNQLSKGGPIKVKKSG